MPDSEQLRLDIGICVKGPEGSEIIEVGSCQSEARPSATGIPASCNTVLMQRCSQLGTTSVWHQLASAEYVLEDAPLHGAELAAQQRSRCHICPLPLKSGW